MTLALKSARVFEAICYGNGVIFIVRATCLAFAIAATALAQEVVLPISEVNRILTTPSDAAARMVKIRGVVNFTVPSLKLCAIQQDGAGLSVRISESAATPMIGDEVEILARLRFESADPDTMVVAETLNVVSHPGVPEPVKSSTVELAAGKYNRRAVVMDGVVLQARFWDDTWILHLADAEGWITGTVYSWPEGWTPPKDWMGANVRLRGVNMGRGPRALRASSLGEVEVIEPGTADPFAVPLVSTSALRASGTSTGRRTRLRATVLAQNGGTVFLRDHGVAFQADFLYPFDVFDRSRPPLLPPLIPSLRTGDQVELVGSPLREGPNLSLRYSVMRVLRAGDALAPLDLSRSALVNGSQVNDLVRTTGRLVSSQQVNVSGGMVETLLVETEDGPVQAALESRSGGAFSKLRIDDLIELTGLMVASGSQPPYMLRILTGRDVRAMGLDPNVSRQRLVRLGAFAIAAFLAVAIWARMLRQQVASRTADLAEANSRLSAEIDERAKAQVELDRALAAERELGELKSRFVALVSHEFRTPLGITMSAVELLRHYADRLSPEKLRELHDDIHEATLRMSGLMEQVLLLGRVEAGKIQFNALPVDLAGLGEKLADEVYSATDARCRIEFHPLDDLSGACGDEGLLRHILSNLLSNAVKYSPEGTSVEFTIARDGDAAVFTVLDRGIGIPVSDQARLFEAFFRATNVGETPGTGLGLLIIKRCVEMHPGTIVFRSIEGEGTTFIVRLPLFARGEV